MPEFAYEAINQQGQPIVGIIEAESKDQAKDKIIKEGNLIKKIGEYFPAGGTDEALANLAKMMLNIAGSLLDASQKSTQAVCEQMQSLEKKVDSLAEKLGKEETTEPQEKTDDDIGELNDKDPEQRS